uniref:Uncharacterized protein n=1 Tax=Parascaris univalens TaxID=6257 RepID=A0A915A5K3_PARUN
PLYFLSRFNAVWNEERTVWSTGHLFLYFPPAILSSFQLISENESEHTAADRVNLLCRFAHACYIRSNNCVKEEEGRKSVLNEAHDACRKAYELEPANAHVLKWCCIITGSLADISSNKERIELGYEFKNYLDEAIELAPDASIYHMRGRFAYDVANLSRLQRMAASELFGAPPTATIDEALADLLKAEDLNPGELDNLLFIAKCFIMKGDMSEARNYLLRMKEDNAVDEADEEMLEEKRQLLKSIVNDSSVSIMAI